MSIYRTKKHKYFANYIVNILRAFKVNIQIRFVVFPDYFDYSDLFFDQKLPYTILKIIYIFTLNFAMKHKKNTHTSLLNQYISLRM